MIHDEKFLNQQIAKYEYIIRIILANFNINANDYHDAFQEGRIGLLKAIMAYKDNKGVSFTSFASICIKRQILSFLRNQNRKKNRIHHHNNIVNYDDIENGINNVKYKHYSIMDNIVNKLYEEYVFKSTLQKLSYIEKNIISSYIIGYTVKEISEKYEVSSRKIYCIIAKTRKSIENKLNG